MKLNDSIKKVFQFSIEKVLEKYEKEFLKMFENPCRIGRRLFCDTVPAS